MLLIFNIRIQREELDFYQPILCNHCEKYGRYEAYAEYSVLRLFVIPFFTVKKRFYVKSTCCNNIYLIKNKEKGLMIERKQGHNVFLIEKDLEMVYKGKSDCKC